MSNFKNDPISERIFDLAEESIVTMYPCEYWTFTNEELQNFARRVVKECAYYNDHLAYPDIIDKHMTAGEGLLNYFGIKEGLRRKHK